MAEYFPVYLLYGSERFFIDEMREKLIQSIAGEPAADIDVASYDLNDVPIEQALEDAETVPFFADKRIVVLKNPAFLTAERKSASSVEHNLKRLEEYLSRPSPHSMVIFEAPYEKLDKRKKIVKALKRSAKVMKAAPLHGNQQISEWVRKQCEKLQIAISGEAIHQLTLLVGADLGALKKELEKLALYVGQHGEATVETVHLLVSRSLEDNVFALVDHVVNKRLDQAFQSLYDLFEQKEEPIKIVSLLARQFRIIAQVNQLSKKGFTQKQMASKLKLHPFAVQQAIRQSRQFSMDECLKMIQLLAEADYLMKSGKYGKQLLLELVLTKVS